MNYKNYKLGGGGDGDEGDVPKKESTPACHKKFTAYLVVTILFILAAFICFDPFAGVGNFGGWWKDWFGFSDEKIGFIEAMGALCVGILAFMAGQVVAYEIWYGRVTVLSST